MSPLKHTSHIQKVEINTQTKYCVTCSNREKMMDNASQNMKIIIVIYKAQTLDQNL